MPPVERSRIGTLAVSDEETITADLRVARAERILAGFFSGGNAPTVLRLLQAPYRGRRS